MKPATQAFTDELVSGIFARFGSAENISVIATGGSMGGHGALLYTLYLIVHGEEDRAVGKAEHSDKLVAAMRPRDLNVDYREQPGMGHCGPSIGPCSGG